MNSLRFRGRSLAGRAPVGRDLPGRLHRARFKLFLNASRTIAITWLALSAVGSANETAFANIYYDSASPNAGQVIPGTQGITPGPGVDLSGWNVSGHELFFAALDNFDLTNASFAKSELALASFGSSNLTNASLANAFLGEADISNANLTSAVLTDAFLQDANLTGAIVKGADFSTTSTQQQHNIVTSTQLQSTASFAARNLSGISLAGNNYPNDGFNFANQNLTNANFSSTNLSASFAGANLTNANLSFANSGYDFSNANLSNADLTNHGFGTATLTNANFTGAVIKGATFSILLGSAPQFTANQLYSTRSYAIRDLSGIAINSDFSDGTAYDLSGWNLTNQNLTGASFRGSKLTDASFNGAVVKGTDFSNGLTVIGYLGGAMTADQLYSTSSYANRDLSGITFVSNFLNGWNFANQNLTNAKLNSTDLAGANFRGANIQGADFAPDPRNPSFQSRFPTNQTNADYTDADLRGATGWTPVMSTVTHNTIRPDGSIQGLALLAGETLVIRDNSIAVTAAISATFDPASTLQFALDPNWTSPVGFASGLTPSLSGALDLELATSANPSAFIGETFQLFNWNGPLPPGDQFSMFATAPGLSWDLSNLCTTGTVTLTGVPEPSPLILAVIASVGGMIFVRRRRPGRVK